MNAGEKPRSQAAEEAVHHTVRRAEEELQRFIRYLNDEVVPEVRRHGSKALYTAAEQLHQLAGRLDDGKP